MKDFLLKLSTLVALKMISLEPKQTSSQRGFAIARMVIVAMFFVQALGLATIEGRPVCAQDFSRVPGVVISYEESPDISLFGVPLSKKYIGTPSITIMPNGDYIASHDLFGNGTNQDQTKIFHSTDQGATWSEQTTITGAFWSTVFEHNGVLYLWGYREQGDNGDILIRKSNDYGVSWTNPTSSSTGLLKVGNYGGTANTPVIYNDRLWISQSGTRVMSVNVNADFLKASSWKLSNSASDTGQPFGADWQGWSEAQIVASPQTGVVSLPKIRSLPFAGRIDVNEVNGDVIFDASVEDAFVSLPGGEKKFGMQYDSVSGKFYALTSTVLPAHKNHPGLEAEPEMIRNTATMLSSKDLINWDVEKIFLYTKNLDNGEYRQIGGAPFGEGFQYFNFAIDEDDMAIVSRTSFDVGAGENRPPQRS